MITALLSSAVVSEIAFAIGESFTGITITGGYAQSTDPNNGELNKVPGYINRTTAITITVELDGRATNMTENKIYIKMGTNTDATAINEYPIQDEKPSNRLF